MPGYLWGRETALRSPDGTAARIAPAPLGSRCAHRPNSPAPCSTSLVRSPCPAPQRSSVTISQFLSVLRPWTVPPPLRSWRPSIYSLISYFFIWDLLSAEQSEKRPPPTSGGNRGHYAPSLPSSQRVTRQGWSPRLPRSSSWESFGLLAVGVHPSLQQLYPSGDALKCIQISPLYRAFSQTHTIL